MCTAVAGADERSLASLFSGLVWGSGCVRHPGHPARGAGRGSGALGAASASKGLPEILFMKVLGSFWHR